MCGSNLSTAVIRPKVVLWVEAKLSECVEEKHMNLESVSHLFSPKSVHSYSSKGINAETEMKSFLHL